MNSAFDAIVIGSGFGGSVAALRLSEKGYRVAVCEQGKRVTPEDMEAASRSPRKLLWMPELGCRGYFSQGIYRHVTVLGGVGVGGGSLVYAGVLLRPKPGYFETAVWRELGVDWASELTPHYETAERMLGVEQNPDFGLQDVYLRDTARALGVEDTFGNVPQGIYFGKPGETAPDPYFDGAGPARRGCNRCGECITGCRYDAKNSLDKNYLHLAERLGAVILPGQRVTAIAPLSSGGYAVQTEQGAELTAAKVIVAAGVQGTLRLLFRCRDTLKTLPHISGRLGSRVRTNSEAIPVVLSRDPDCDLTEGATISSHFYFDSRTHVTQNRYPRGYEFMKWLLAPMIDDPVPSRRILRLLAACFRHPSRATSAIRARNFHKRVTALTVMQHCDNELTLRYGRSVLTGFRKGLVSATAKGAEPPSYIPEAAHVARVFAEQSNGIALDYLPSTLFGAPVTAHILGGACMGRSAEDGVVDESCQVFGYPGLYITDASVIPSNVGVNPSLTITALAERTLSRVPVLST